MPTGSNLARIIHVSGDFPDSIAPDKTPVIRSLIDLTSERFDHHVISINRIPPSFGEAVSLISGGSILSGQQEFSYGEAWEYRAPGKGVMHKQMLNLLGDHIAQQLAMDGRKPALLVAHKLTIEGVAVARAAKLLDVPYALCIQGDTDTKILAARSDLRGEFARIFHQAEIVFPFTPWAQEAVEARLGKRTGPTQLLPCPTDLDEPLAPKVTKSGLVSAFHLKNYRRKNLRGMADAMRWMKSNAVAPGLAIVGGGSEADRTGCARLVSDCPEISFAGPLDRAGLRARLNQASALLLPSLRESFGLVFVEALFAGAPIIYPHGAAIDGYFDGASFAIPVDARDPYSISEAMRFAIAHEAELKADLQEWQTSAAARVFQRPSIAHSFASGLNQAIQ